MRVGLTYDVKTDYAGWNLTEEELAEFDRPDTIDAIESALGGLGYETERIGNIRALTARLAAGQRWDMVFNIAEGLYGFGRESAIPALLDSYRIPYTFSDPMVMSLALHKGMTKHVMRSFGIPTPDFAVVGSLNDVEAVNLPFPLFVKPVAEGTSKGVGKDSKVESPDQLRNKCAELLARLKQPVLVETYLPGREFTVGVVGSNGDVTAMAMEICYRDRGTEAIYCFESKENCEELIDYVPATDAAAEASIDLAVRSWRQFGLRDAARIDVRLDGRESPNVLEINPLPGLHPEHSDLPIMWTQTGRAYPALISEITRSCLSRTW